MFGYSNGMFGSNGSLYGSNAMTMNSASSAMFSPFQSLSPLSGLWSGNDSPWASEPALVPAFLDATKSILDGYSQALGQLSSAFSDVLAGQNGTPGQSPEMPGQSPEMPGQSPGVPEPEVPANDDMAQNVIFMVPDGFGTDYSTAFRTFKGGEELPAWEAEDMLTGAIKTESANSLITDSAAAGTAFATGQKTDNGRISTAPDGSDLTTLVDLANAAGKSTGVVATSTITHATPAVFGANVDDRDDQHLIAQQYIDDNKLDVMLGGGRDYFVAEEDGGAGVADLLSQAESQGYTLLDSASDLESVEGDRLLGLFADDALDTSYGESGDDQPTLAQMTQTALDTLSQNEDGFFMMVEGSQIDWAGHANDAGWAMNDSLAFEDAVKTAQQFSEDNPDTLIVIAPDHETGGMSAQSTQDNNASTYQNFTATYEQMYVEASERIEAAGMSMDDDGAAWIMQGAVAEMTGGDVLLTDDELSTVLSAEDSDAGLAALTQTLNEYGGISFSSGNHTAENVPLYASGPGSDIFSGLLDNTEVGQGLATAMGLEFADAGSAEVMGVDNQLQANEMAVA
ncbi:alkaline phosphatase [Kushneria indalinina]|uniref:Alkaline phosphatase n=1 Tax=Kushneria indalinina DSM 14324 TaxID=1122140 RepID=A0A3D9DUE6_9GAMM|nr:alkaline phosphatase [Kushneria indalinina]REC94301.1 alkaline phosphatase [Kushneria indalinina DSM 14324]